MESTDVKNKTNDNVDKEKNKIKTDTPIEQNTNDKKLKNICLWGCLLSIISYGLAIFTETKYVIILLFITYLFKLILGNNPNIKQKKELDYDTKSFRAILILMLLPFMMGIIYILLLLIAVLTASLKNFLLGLIVILTILFMLHNRTKNLLRKSKKIFYILFVYSHILFLILLINNIALHIFI